jgi:hypothetical protein
MRISKSCFPGLVEANEVKPTTVPSAAVYVAGGGW